ncbi:MAG: hypothetical protein OWQ50_01985 [Acidianus infernus]|nr:hypothetical protein [Acidianus infernus]
MISDYGDNMVICSAYNYSSAFAMKVKYLREPIFTCLSKATTLLPVRPSSYVILPKNKDVGLFTTYLPRYNLKYAK